MALYFGQILEQSCLMFPLVLGIYLSFTVLKIADLTVDGSMVFGAAVFARLVSTGTHWSIAMSMAVMGGAIAGLVVSVVQRRNRIDPLIAGILMAFILNSLSLVVMKRPNIGLLSSSMLFEQVRSFASLPMPYARLLSLSLLAALLALGMAAFLTTKQGLWLKAFGNNETLVALLGKNPERLRMLGLSLSNALAALSGCLTAQASGYADINMGIGQALVGIAMILVGRQLLHLFAVHKLMHDGAGIICTLLGIIIYFILINEVVRYGLNPVYLKMAIGGFLIVFLWVASDQATHGRSMMS